MNAERRAAGRPVAEALAVIGRCVEGPLPFFQAAKHVAGARAFMAKIENP